MTDSLPPPTTRIERVLAVPAVGAGCFGDRATTQAHGSTVAEPERTGPAPVATGTGARLEVVEAVSVGLVLSDGRVAWGDCVGLAQSARAGGNPLFRTLAGLASIQQTVGPALEGRTPTEFRELAVAIEALCEPVEILATEAKVHQRPSTTEETARFGDGQGATPITTDEAIAPPTTVSRRSLFRTPVSALKAAAMAAESSEAGLRVVVQRSLHPAVRYGVSQALLQAVAWTRGETMAEVIAREWGLPAPSVVIPIHAQSGAGRYHSVETMIVRRITSLPHGSVEGADAQLGPDGSDLTRYIRWLRGRIEQLGSDDYWPTIHLDVQGGLGLIYGSQVGRMLGQLYAWEQAANPYPLRIESAMIRDSREAQIAAMRTLREAVRARRMKVQLVADEWVDSLEDVSAFLEGQAADMIHVKLPHLGGLHNSVDAVLACKEGGVGALLGGSHTETDLSARVSVHVALAARPHLLMAKPGLGVDEALSLVGNEMARTLAQNGASRP